MPNFIKNNENEDLAYEYLDNGGVCLVWLSGYHSDMSGTKALEMEETAKELGFSSLRLDYSGHGQSCGEFEDGTISKWLNDALLVINHLNLAQIILVGSSMGGWISLLAGKILGERLKGLILIAPAPDFTEDLMWNEFSDEIKQEVLEYGYWLRPSEYDPTGYKVTKQLLDDGRNHLIMRHDIEINVPVRILQGMRDEDVPYLRALILADRLVAENIRVVLVKDGDHRLSREQDLQLLRDNIREIAQIIS